jgi:ComF family protein
MHFISHVKDLFTDFLFPKSPEVLELEALSVENLLDTLPRATSLLDKHSTALFDYSHPLVKKIVWELKYGGNTIIADRLGEILYDHICLELEDLALFESANWRMSKPLLLPIPISGKRRFERGWNQSELLCEKIMKHDNQRNFRYLPKALAKVLHTESQTKTRSKDERLENLANSMKVLNAQSVRGEYVVVVDDVTTTGSTFSEARRALKTAGVKKILCVAVAH